MDNSFELHMKDERYPESLKDLEDPPPVLYAIGNIELLNTLAVSIIGSRKASPYGLAAAKMCAEVSVSHGLTVVSGAAIGCDLQAGKHALDLGGSTIAILGCGADRIYPSQAKDFLLQLKSGKGLVISEQPWGHKPLPWTFPKRNRIIAALSGALIVVEASLKSGTSSTAEAGFALGREVYAVPGSIFSKTSQGCNQIISDGAGIIVDKQSLDIAFSSLYESFAFRYQDEGNPKNISDPILKALVSEPYDTEQLFEISQMKNISEFIRCMSAYELDGTVVKLKDGRYSLSTDAYNRLLQ